MENAWWRSVWLAVENRYIEQEAEVLWRENIC